MIAPHQMGVLSPALSDAGHPGDRCRRFGIRSVEVMRSLPPDPDELARRSDLERVVGDAKSELRIEMRDLTVGQTRTLMLGMVGSVTALTIGQLVVTLVAR